MELKKYCNSEQIQALDVIFSAIKTIKNPKALKTSIIKNLVLIECPCPDYYAFLMTTRANNNSIQTVHDVMSLLVKRKESPIPAELSDDGETFDLKFFYDSHPQIAEMSEQKLETCMIKGQQIKDMFKKWKLSKSKDAFDMMGCMISPDDVDNENDMSVKRLLAAVGLRCLLENKGFVSSLGLAYDFSKCMEDNRDWNKFIFTELEFIPKCVKKGHLVLESKYIGSLFALGILVDYQTYKNTKKEEEKMSLKQWLDMPAKDGVLSSMSRNMSHKVELDPD